MLNKHPIGYLQLKKKATQKINYAIQRGAKNLLLSKEFCLMRLRLGSLIVWYKHWELFWEVLFSSLTLSCLSTWQSSQSSLSWSSPISIDRQIFGCLFTHKGIPVPPGTASFSLSQGGEEVALRCFWRFWKEKMDSSVPWSGFCCMLHQQ